MNSLYDPNVTGSGVQPEYFDFWASLYQYYRVTRCVVYVTASYTTGTVPIRFGLVPLPTTNAFSPTDPS